MTQPVMTTVVWFAVNPPAGASGVGGAGSEAGGCGGGAGGEGGEGGEGGRAEGARSGATPEAVKAAEMRRTKACGHSTAVYSSVGEPEGQPQEANNSQPRRIS